MAVTFLAVARFSCSRCVLRFRVPPALAGLPRQPLQLGIVGREPETSCSRIWVLQACSARARLPRRRPRRHVALGVGHLLRLRLELGVSHECCCVEPLLDICDGRQMRCMIGKLEKPTSPAATTITCHDSRSCSRVMIQVSCSFTSSSVLLVTASVSY